MLGFDSELEEIEKENTTMDDPEEVDTPTPIPTEEFAKSSKEGKSTTFMGKVVPFKKSTPVSPPQQASDIGQLAQSQEDQ